MIRSVDLWDLPMPLGLRHRREMVGVRTKSEHRVVQGRNTDHRPVRTWDWRRDGINEPEHLRFEELYRVTAGCMPVDLWLPRRNALVWTDDMLRGSAGRSAHYGWDVGVEADTALTASGVASPLTGSALRMKTAVGATASGEIHQEVGRTPRREAVLTLSVYLANDDSKDFRMEIYDDAGTSVYGDFLWSAGALASVSGSDASAAVSVKVHSGTWYRAVLTVTLAATTALFPARTLGVRFYATPGATANDGHHLYGPQLVLGSLPLEYMQIGGDRVSPVPVTMEDARFDLHGGVHRSVGCRLVEVIE